MSKHHKRHFVPVAVQPQAQNPLRYHVSTPGLPSREFATARQAFDYFLTLAPGAHSSVSLHAVPHTN